MTSPRIATTTGRTPVQDSLSRNKPTLFRSAVIRTLADSEGHGSQILRSVDLDSVKDLSLGSTSSWRYNLPEQGLQSTQQLQVDWSQFQNHTFFQSAQAKTQVAFDRVLNHYPFAGTQPEVEEFLDTLTGFEKWVYDQVPKSRGYLFLSGSNTGDTAGGAGSWFRVADSAGLAFSGISKDQTGRGFLDPGLKSMTVEFHLYLPVQANDNSAVLSKLSSSADLAGQHGWTLVLSASTSPASASLVFYGTSGSYIQSATIPVTKGEFQHVGVVWNRNPGVHKVFGYRDQVLVASSSQGVEIGFVDTRGTALVVGSGSQVRTSTFVPRTTLSGALDELRVWHVVRSQQDLQGFARKGLFAQEGLKGYWKFNEPQGVSTRLITDHGGHDLHGELGSAAVVLGTRNYVTTSLPPGPMTSEQDRYNPVLFPRFQHLVDFRSRLLLSGSRYDLENPNLITRLIPRHYLQEGQEQEALETEEGPVQTEYLSGTELGTGKLSPSQVMVLLLYVWAKHFDEIKLFLDAFVNLQTVSYGDEGDTVPDAFLQWFANQNGFHLPQLWRNSSVAQFVNGENLDLDPGVSDRSLQYVQNQIWRRILVNLQEIIRTKGTVHGIKSFIRCLGVDPDTNFRFREFGGPNHAVLDHARETRSEVTSMFTFLSGGQVRSPFLSASRVEPGVPGTVGPLNTAGVGISGSDGLFTSGSWTWEGTYRFDPRSDYWATQSLVRVYTTGANTVPGEGSLVANLVTFKPGTVALYLKANPLSTVPYLKMEVSGSTIQDGDPWYVSFGRRRAEEVGSTVSASYFLRVAKQSYGTVTDTWVTESLFQDTGRPGTTNVFSVMTGSWNASGSWFVLGTTSSDYTPASHLSNSFLNDSVAVPEPAARMTLLRGKVAQVRFWSKALENEEWLEHVRNPKSLGVENPTKNFNFVDRQVSGSWERLRVDVSMDQPVLSSSAAGTMTLFDFSQNARHLTGSNLPPSTPVILPDRWWWSTVSTRFDEASNNEKVRVRSFQGYSNVLSSSYATVAPVYALDPSETPVDDTRFSVDFSVVDALNQDIMTLLSSLGWMNNAIGAPELAFSPTYPALDTLREVYFNRLVGKLNLKTWYDFYKWFDMNTGWFISQILPRKTKFLGVNFVIESHNLERSKVEYQWADHYVGESNRVGLRDSIYMSLVSGVGKRY